jgi:glycosyltransferase involved in cell wall biosynthesis
MYKPLHKRLALWQWNKIAKEIFNGATAILPICKYLEKMTNEFVPNQPTDVVSEGIDASKWYHVEGLKLKHPCVGLLQQPNKWDKTSEMLVLDRVIEKMPDVHFYWAGNGPLLERILPTLNKHDNFHWLGRLQYPDKVREYLSEIDVYALVTGVDMSPLSLKEAQLMKKPVVATDVAGVPEMMIDGETGFLVEKGNHEQLIKKLRLLLEDGDLAKKMGNEGRKFVEETFNWELVTKNFIKIAKSYLK